jgi:hypothetical protein
MKTPEYALARLAPPESNALAYPYHDRANDVYGMWLTGYTEDEIANFTSLSVEDIKKDLMYVNTKLSPRQIISHNNERERIMLQRENSEGFRKMMKDSLNTPVQALLDVGLSPASVLKEYREATGMVQKAEPLLQINTQINQSQATTGSIQSAEDVIRRVLNQIDSDSQANQEVIDAEYEDQEEQETSDSETVHAQVEDHRT